MKIRAVLVFALMAAAMVPALAFLPEALAVVDTGDEEHEFYFTRLIYSGGRGGRGRSANAFGLDDKNICQDADSMRDHNQRGQSWATDYPEADCKFMWGVERMTNARIHKEPHAVRIMDDRLFEYPFVYAVEVGNIDLSDEEAMRLREYLDRGGFWWCDDFWGPDEWDQFAYNLAKVFPEHAKALEDPQNSPLVITPQHDSFHTFFDINTVMQIPNISLGTQYTRSGGTTRTWEDPSDTEPKVLGITDERGRLQVLITYNSDLGDAWEHMDNPEYPEKFSGQAYRMGMNFIIFGMTH